jgi:hypothetical protein
VTGASELRAAMRRDLAAALKAREPDGVGSTEAAIRVASAPAALRVMMVVCACEGGLP